MTWGWSLTGPARCRSLLDVTTTDYGPGVPMAENTTQPAQDWRPTSAAGVRAWLLHLAAALDADGWTGREDWNDPHLPAVLTLTDADGTIEVHIRPSALYEPTL